MSYNKTIWKSKDIITREKMQKIEDQLEVLSEQGTSGSSSGTSDYLELENKPQINGVTLTGNKSLTDLGVAATSDVAAKYTKPGTGIPASDLSSTVQASLQKADTALQGENLTSVVNNYIETNFSNPSSPPLDRTLSTSSSAAPADMVGELKSAIDDANIEIADLQDGFTWSMDGLRLSQTVGSAMQVNGQVMKNSNWRYYSVHLDDTDAIYYAMGYSWHGNIMPYIFIADNTGGISYTEFERATTPTFHDNIRFRIKTTGTLYLNCYGTSRSVFAYKSVLLAAKSTDVATNAVADYHTRMIDRLFVVSSEAISYSEKLEGYVLDGSTGKPRLIDQSATQFVVEKYTVNPFDTYHVIASHYYGNGIFSVFDADGNCLYLVYDEDGGASYTTYDADYTMPYNAAYCYIAYNTGHAAGSIVMRVPSLPPAPTPYIGKKWIALGDSLTAASTLGQNVKNYVNYVSESLGLTAYNKGDGGTGYWYRHIYNSAFYQRAANFTEDADIITIFGSFNDLGTEDGVSGATIIGTYTDSTTSTICGCINETIDVLIEKYPNAIIGIIAPTPWENSHGSTGAAQETYVSRLKQICEYRSVPFLDLFHASSLRPWDSAFRTTFYHNADGAHPNTEGHKRFTPMIVDFIKRILY